MAHDSNPAAVGPTRIGNRTRDGTAAPVAQAVGTNKHVGSSAPTAEDNAEATGTNEGVDNPIIVRIVGNII